jgi:hypothetical protein
MIIALERLCGVVATYVGYAPPPKLQEVRLTRGPLAFCLLRVEGGGLALPFVRNEAAHQRSLCPEGLGASLCP